MAITTYATLQSAIITHAMRSGDTDFAAAVPDFITGCEQLFNYGSESLQGLRLADMETTVTLTPVNGVAALPADYLQFRRVMSGTHVLQPAEPGWAANYYDGAGPATGKFFTVTGSSLTVFPVSDAPIALTYYAKIPALSNANTTNWLLTKAPMAYLYGSLLHAAPFGMDDARIQTYGTLFSQAVGGLIKSDAMGRYARSVSRVRGPTP